LFETSFLPFYFECKAIGLSKGPGVLSDDHVKGLLESIRIWGVCAEYTFDDNVVVHDGFASVLSSFVRHPMPVPFLAVVALGDMMYRLGAELLCGSDEEHPLVRHGHLVRNSAKRRKLEYALVRNGGSTTHLGFTARTEAETACLNALHLFHDDCYPTDKEVICRVLK
jgi:hypothetical protein